jgi:GT2 family glycosyltransferase
MNSPKVYISVVNWYKHETTALCVQSLLKMDYQNFEIIIVDNNSKNGSVKYLNQEFPSIQIIESKENLGYAGGNKLVVDLAIENNIELIWVLNNDTKVKSNSLTELVKSYQKYGKAVYSNLTLLSENPDIIHYSGSYFPGEESLRENTYDKLKGKLLSEVYDNLEDREARIYGHSLLIPLSVINQCGFMDVNYFMYHEELDYFKTLATFGIKTRFVKNAIITHESAGSIKEDGELNARLLLVLLYYGKRNQYYFDLKWNDLAKGTIIRDRGGWFTLIKFFLKHFMRRDKNVLKENYILNLAAWHAYRGIRGKTVDPANFL